ncbi:MAG: hypothetical protein H0T60_02545 [Acidobacteria bacterium]|nr:hypothetical protein [Acidobacteriota bacterium]
MAQLRDAKTSEFLAEGTLLEVAVLARGYNNDEVIFDGAAEAFEPASVIEQAEESAEGFEAVAKSTAKAISKETKEAAKAEAARLREVLKGN